MISFVRFSCDHDDMAIYRFRLRLLVERPISLNVLLRLNTACWIARGGLFGLLAM
jgi:hypothetical protein